MIIIIHNDENEFIVRIRLLPVFNNLHFQVIILERKITKDFYLTNHLLVLNYNAYDPLKKIIFLTAIFSLHIDPANLGRIYLPGKGIPNLGFVLPLFPINWFKCMLKFLKKKVHCLEWLRILAIHKFHSVFLIYPK